MTLFDHYCARLHTGLALDGADRARAARRDRPRDRQTPGALAFHPFRRGALAAARATLRAPLELADLASGGALRKLLAKQERGRRGRARRRDRAGDGAPRSPNKDGFLARTVAAVEVQLSRGGQPVPRRRDRLARSPLARARRGGRS